MSGRVRIRAMVHADLEAVMAIERASFAMPWTLATFQGLLDRADSHLFVAEAAEAATEAGPAVVVGYAVVWIVVDQAELGNIAVSSEWRGRGIARMLLETVLERVRELRVRELFLEVRPSNHGARGLYERYGFIEIGRRKGYYSRPREDALLLRRAIAQPADGPTASGGAGSNQLT